MNTAKPRIPSPRTGAIAGTDFVFVLTCLFFSPAAFLVSAYRSSPRLLGRRDCKLEREEQDVSWLTEMQKHTQSVARVRSECGGERREEII